jgi:hypothetical protein
MAEPRPDGADRFELRASVEGREVVFDELELWWCEPEPPAEEYPTFTLTTGVDAPPGAPRLEVECAAPDATTFRDLAGASFALAPLAAEKGGGWVSVDLGRDWKERGFPGREWVASEANVRFDTLREGLLEGAFEAALEKSRAGGDARHAALRIVGRFRARAPRW